MLSYAIKRVIRSMGLFAALLLGVALASTFFAGINIGADTTAQAALKQRLSRLSIDITIGGWQVSNSTVWATVASNVKTVNNIIGAEVISQAYWWGDTTFENYTSLRITGISNVSNVYDGLDVTQGAGSLGENETYVWVNSKSADKIELNSTIMLNFTYVTEYYPSVKESFVSVSVKVVGFIELDEKAYSIVTKQWYGPVIVYQPTREALTVYDENLLIVSWEKTFAKLLDATPSNASYHGSSPFTTQILAYLNRDALINAWDIPNSLTAVTRVTDQVNQAIASYGMYANNNLNSVLMEY